MERGNTPTRVGKTCNVVPLSPSSGKHPHAGGEDPIPTPWANLNVGNTPTRVGKTFLTTSKSITIGKHPHAGGEDGSPQKGMSLMLETPPRGWGRLCPQSSNNHDFRNTPTRVGKTETGTPTNRGRWKLPHAGGEDRGPRSTTGSHWETPPRGWGRPAVVHGTVKTSGNTPTRVGKTLTYY